MKNLNKKLIATSIGCVCLVLVPLFFSLKEGGDIAPEWCLYAIIALLIIASVTGILAFIRHLTGADQYDNL